MRPEASVAVVPETWTTSPTRTAREYPTTGSQGVPVETFIRAMVRSSLAGRAPARDTRGMGRIYTGLAAWNLLFLGTAFALGLLRGGAVEPRVHLLAGLFSAIFCCLVHAIVFAHFIGSGKWIKRGVDAAGMDEAIVKRTKRFKGKTFPFALFSMLFVIATAVLGGAADQQAASPAVHLSFAVATVALNVVATL